MRKLIAVIGDSANAGSIGVHRGQGFAHVGVLKDCGWKFGEWRDVVLMEKVLGEGSTPPAPNEEQDAGGLARLSRRPVRPALLLPVRLRRPSWAGALPIPTALGLYGIERVRLHGLDDQRSWVLIPMLGFTIAGCALTAIVYGLMTPREMERPLQSGRAGRRAAGRTSWFTIGAVVLSLLVGTTVLMASIAFSFQRYFEYQVEEGRKISQ